MYVHVTYKIICGCYMIKFINSTTHLVFP